MNEEELKSDLPRIAMISTHGYVSATPPLGAADTGGQVVYVLELSKKLGQLGYEVDIWTRRFEDQPEVEPISEQVRIIRAPCGGPDFIPKEYLYKDLPEWTRNALAYIKEHKLQYQFINSHYWDAGIAGRNLSRALGVPHAHTPHSLGIWKQREMEKDSPDDRARMEKEYNFKERIHYERQIYRSCDLLVATTPIQTDMLGQDYKTPPEKTRMIPPGYDDNRFFPVGQETRQAIRQRLGLSGSHIVALGRLAKNKGYDLLIRAFKLVEAREPSAVLNLAVGGSGALSSGEQAILDELKALTLELGLGEKVLFSGYVPDEDLADYYRGADEFVLSSRYEPFGMTAIEAMACGTPTIVTIHGGLWRAVTFGRHALVADPFDTEDLGIMMLKPFRIPKLWARMSQMGAQKSRSLFAWTAIAHYLLRAIEQRQVKGAALVDTEWDEPWLNGD